VRLSGPRFLGIGSRMGTPERGGRDLDRDVMVEEDLVEGRCLTWMGHLPCASEAWDVWGN